MGLSSNDLLNVGIKPGQIFGKCLKCATIEEALVLWNDSPERTHEEIYSLCIRLHI